MKPDELEPRLRRLSLRGLPPQWREEILAAAGARNTKSAQNQIVSEPRGVGIPRFDTPWWLAWQMPSRAGWAALGATWMIILILNFAGSANGSRAGAVVRTSAEPWLEQRRIVAEFLGLPMPQSAQSDLPAATRPRSERHANYILLWV